MNEAHGKGMALQFNYLMDKGAIVVKKDGSFAVDFQKIKGAVTDLTHDLLTIEAQGDYTRAKQMLNHLVEIRPAMAAMLKRMEQIPTDVAPL